MAITSPGIQFSTLVVRAVLNSGVRQSDLARALGERPGFIDAILNAEERLSREHVRLLEESTGVSAELWALRSFDRSRLEPHERVVVEEAVGLVVDLDKQLVHGGMRRSARRNGRKPNRSQNTRGTSKRPRRGF